MLKDLYLRHIIHPGLILAFLGNLLGVEAPLMASVLLPAPGSMVHLSPSYNPPVLKGIKVHPENPFRFDFVMDVGAGLAPAQNIAQNNRATARVAPTENKIASQIIREVVLPALTKEINQGQNFAQLRQVYK